jgi:hypothetical protein
MTRPFIDRIRPAPVAGGFSDPDHWIWCGSAIRGGDGRYHLFASMWTRAVPFSPNWLTNSRVVRAVADTATGPYDYVEDVLPPRGAEHWDGLMTHNPTIHRCPRTGTYLLYYTGSTFSGTVPTDGPPTDAQRLEARANQRIGLAVADDVSGPWRRANAGILQPRAGRWDALMTTNPAPCLAEDGSVLLAYKSCTTQDDPIQYGVAGAAAFDGAYERLRDEPLIAAAADQHVSYEDAYLWRGPSGYEMIFNDMTGYFTGEDHAGGHAVSADGVNWRLAEPPKAYSRQILWDDGQVTTQGSFERPQLLIEAGVPTHLFAATADGPGGFWRASRTWNMVVPLGDADRNARPTKVERDGS